MGSTAAERRTVPLDSTSGNGRAGRSIGELFASVTDQFSRLVRDEIQLAKIQMAEKGKRLGVGAGFLGVAGVMAAYGFGVLLAAAVLALALVLPAWLSALIVAVVLFVIAAIAGFIGKKKIDASKEFAPAPQEGLKEDIEAVKKGIQK